MVTRPAPFRTCCYLLFLGICDLTVERRTYRRDFTGSAA